MVAVVVARTMVPLGSVVPLNVLDGDTDTDEEGTVTELLLTTNRDCPRESPVGTVPEVWYRTSSVPSAREYAAGCRLRASEAMLMDRLSRGNVELNGE